MRKAVVVLLGVLAIASAGWGSPILGVQVNTSQNSGNGPVGITASAQSSAGFVSVTPQNIGSFFLAGLVGVSRPVLSGPSLLSLTSTLVNTASGADDVSFSLTWSGLTAPVGHTFASVLGGVLSGNGSWIKINSYFVPQTRTLSGLSLRPFASCTFVNAGAGANTFACHASDDVTLARLDWPSYSLVEYVTVHLAPGADLSFADQLQAVPEPTSLALFGAGILGVVVRRVRERSCWGGDAKA